MQNFTNEKTINVEILKFLINESVNVIDDAKINKQLVTAKKINEHVANFRGKRSDSNDYKKSLEFLKNYYDDSNKKKIDL